MVYSTDAVISSCEDQHQPELDASKNRGRISIRRLVPAFR